METTGSDSINHRLSPAPSRDEGGGKPKAATATLKPERNSIVPPYWQRHERSSSRLSVNSASEGGGKPRPILLEDHTDEGSEQCKALWAKHVTIDDYVIVSGSAPGLGAYVVWNCTVETLDVSMPAPGRCGAAPLTSSSMCDRLTSAGRADEDNQEVIHGLSTSHRI